MYASCSSHLLVHFISFCSRICRPGPGERNFHIFYQLLASNYCKPLKLSPSAAEYAYLNCSDARTVDGVDDKEEFDITLAAMRNVGMNNKVIQGVLSMVAAVLHLGNVRFTSKQVDGAEGSSIDQNSKHALLQFCELAKIEPEMLVQVLTFRELQTMAPGGNIDTYQVPQSPTQAGVRRDAISKAIFSNVFDLIVLRINAALRLRDEDFDTSELLSISVLDIYGFEVFKNNGFEQLCINYVNEKLQQIFIELTLRAEQEEYEREGIAWKPIPFFNNKVVCDLLDGSKPPGVFRVLDDTCKTMHGTKAGIDIDRKFIETSSQVHGRHKHFSTGNGGFIIKHYAGDVTYSAGSIGEANKDGLNKDLLLAIKSTSDQLLGHLFQEEVDSNDKKAAKTASFKIRQQCSALVAALMDCAPHYVRCIKSNDKKQALKIDTQRVKHQVKYLGLVENIKVRRAGFAYRAEYHRFLERFGIITSQTYPEYKGSDRDGCKVILNQVAKQNMIPGLNKEECQLGKSKVFIRAPETYFAFERLLEIRRGDFVTRIQRAWRKHASQKDYNVMSNQIARIYRQNGKMRRRDSIFRPYSGDYLCELPTSIQDQAREGIFKIIDHHNEKENILFVDSNVSTLHKSFSGNCKYEVIKTLLVITDCAIYICSVSDVPGGKKRVDAEVGCLGSANSASNEKLIPFVVLRKRILLGNKDKKDKTSPSLLHSVLLSKQADEAMVIKLRQASLLDRPIIDHWVKDDDTLKCHSTGEVFTFFSRRHHCRACGNVFMDKVADYFQPLPDYGHYRPVRICDECVGFKSFEGNEDIVLLCARKSEIVAILQSAYQKSGLPTDLRTTDLSVLFSNSIKLETIYSSSSPAAAMCRLVANEVGFQVVDKRIPMNPDCNYIEGHQVSIEVNAGKATICSEAGLPHDVVEKKQKNKLARQKKAAAKRKQEEAERQERRAIKEQQREQERLQRLAEKKARKVQEKAMKAAAVEESQAAVRTSAPPPMLRKAPTTSGSSSGGVMSGGAGGELAKLMAKRRASMNSD